MVPEEDKLVNRAGVEGVGQIGYGGSRSLTPTLPPADEGFRQVWRQILSGVTDQLWRVVSHSGDGEHITECGDSLDMDRPPTRRGHVLLAPGGRAEEVAHFVMGPAEAGSAGVSLESPHRPVAPLYGGR